MNNDLISRSELKKAYFKAINETSIGEVSIIDLIDNAPTIETDIEVVAQDAYKQGYTDGWKERFGEPNEKPQGEWIPVSERLPDVEQDVLVCLIYKDTTHFVVTRLLNNKQWLCFSDVEVIAWQPLPEPYREGGAE